MSSFKQKPKVLVLLACYNGSNWIDEQITSILRQSSVDISLIISDDASNDATVKLVKNKISQYNNIILLENKFPSGSAGKNFVRLLTEDIIEEFDYVALSDQDDVWQPCKMIEGIHFMNASNADGYSCSVTLFDSNSSGKTINQAHLITKLDFLFEGAGQGCTFILSKKSFSLIQDYIKTNKNKISSFHYHDWLIYLVLRALRCNWAFDQRSWILYRQHEGNEIGHRWKFSSIIKRINLVKSNWYKRQIQLACEIYLLINPGDLFVQKFSIYYNMPNSIYRKLVVSYYVFYHGRRRVVDRVMLVVFIWMNWI